MHGPAHDRRDFSTQVEAVARGVRQLAQIGDPVLRDAVAAALRLRDGDMRLDPAARARMRRQVLAAISPVRLTFADHLMTVFAILAKPTPTLMRLLAVGLASVGLLAGATVASADSLPDEALYGFKLAGEQLRLGIASTPEDRAAVGISIAAHRLGEAERLAAAGRDDATIDVTAAYGLSLANAAAELASVERLKPKWGALVVQLQAQLAAQQDRVDAIAKRPRGGPADRRCGRGARRGRHPRRRGDGRVGGVDRRGCRRGDDPPGGGRRGPGGAGPPAVTARDRTGDRRGPGVGRTRSIGLVGLVGRIGWVRRRRGQARAGRRERRSR